MGGFLLRTSRRHDDLDVLGGEESDFSVQLALPPPLVLHVPGDDVDQLALLDGQHVIAGGVCSVGKAHTALLLGCKRAAGSGMELPPWSVQLTASRGSANLALARIAAQRILFHINPPVEPLDGLHDQAPLNRCTVAAAALAWVADVLAVLVR